MKPSRKGFLSSGTRELKTYLMMASESCRPSRLRYSRSLQRQMMLSRAAVGMMELDRSIWTSSSGLNNGKDIKRTTKSIFFNSDFRRGQLLNSVAQRKKIRQAVTHTQYLLIDKFTVGSYERTSAQSFTSCWTHSVPVKCSSSTKERGQRSLRTPVFSTCCRAWSTWVNPSRSTLRHRDSSNLGQTHRQEGKQSGLCAKCPTVWSKLPALTSPRMHRYM